MQLALLLVVLVIAELALTVWLLARHKSYLSDTRDLRSRMSDVERKLSGDNHESVQGDVDLSAALAAANEVSAKATPEEMEQARQILSALGIKEQ